MSDFAGWLDDRTNANGRDPMIWLLLPIALVTIVMAGRTHSKRLDELDRLHAQGNLNKSWRTD